MNLSTTLPYADKVKIQHLENALLHVDSMLFCIRVIGIGLTEFIESSDCSLSEDYTCSVIDILKITSINLFHMFVCFGNRTGQVTQNCHNLTQNCHNLTQNSVLGNFMHS
jgi:hypothetical protein